MDRVQNPYRDASRRALDSADWVKPCAVSWTAPRPWSALARDWSPANPDWDRQMRCEKEGLPTRWRALSPPVPRWTSKTYALPNNRLRREVALRVECRRGGAAEVRPILSRTSTSEKAR